MKRNWYLFLILCFMLLIFTGCPMNEKPDEIEQGPTAAPAAIPTPEPLPPIDLWDIEPEYIICGDYLHLDSLRMEPLNVYGLDVENNVWGVGDIKCYKQCIYQVKIDSVLPLGWAWNWPTETENVKAFPEVVYGKKPWAGYTTVEGILPAQIQKISNIILNYNLDTYVEGTCNLSFDVWINSEESGIVSNITHEVMIWLDNLGMDPISNKDPVLVTIDDKDFYYFSGEADHAEGSDGWIYHAFVIEEIGEHDTIKHFEDTIKVHEFINYLTALDDNDEYKVDNSNYISSIEFGNEIISGSGHTKINDYSISITFNPQ